MKAISLTLLLATLIGGFLWTNAASTQPFQPEPAINGKPRAAVGWLDVQVIDRPSHDRAVIRATWTRGHAGENCRLLFLAPEGASLMEGLGETILDPDAQSGDVTWLVDFPTDRDLDAVIRLCADTELGTFACESYAVLSRVRD